MNKIIIDNAGRELRSLRRAHPGRPSLLVPKKKPLPRTQKERRKKSTSENVVTLTKANLQHVEIKTEPAMLGNLETTLRAAGRVSENMNKTAKVVSTLEGRLIKLNYDLNDRVKAGDVVALVQTPELLGQTS